MKKFLSLIFLAIFMFSCSEDEPASSDNNSGTLSTSADAKQEFNMQNFGLYKGVMVGSSGVITVNLNNNDAVTATLMIDGTTYNFTTTESVSLGTDVSGLTFINGNSSFDFNVNAQGHNPMVSEINIDGHPDANIEILKEYSDAHVRCFLGTYSGDAAGVFNLISIDNMFYGLAKPNNDTYSLWLEAVVTDNSINGIFDAGTFTGQVSGNNISGSWSNSIPESGNWSGTRKL